MLSRYDKRKRERELKRKRERDRDRRIYKTLARRPGPQNSTLSVQKKKQKARCVPSRCRTRVKHVLPFLLGSPTPPLLLYSTNLLSFNDPQSLLSSPPYSKTRSSFSLPPSLRKKFKRMLSLGSSSFKTWRISFVFFGIRFKNKKKKKKLEVANGLELWERER